MYKYKILVAIFVAFSIFTSPVSVLAQSGSGNSNNSNTGNSDLQTQIDNLLKLIRDLQSQVGNNPNQIRITSPVQNQVYSANENFVIYWSGGRVGESFIAQVIRPDGSQIDTGTAVKIGTNFSITWVRGADGYPAFVNGPGVYSIRLLRSDNTITTYDNEVISQTVNFTFGTGSTQNNYAGSSITVVYPNGGETLEDNGEDVIANIKWKTEKFGKLKVSINLIDERGASVKTIAHDIKNSGSFKWKSYSSVIPGKYKIRISTFIVGPQLTIEDYSDGYFDVETENLKSGDIEIIYPNGGESWEVGKTYKIKFDARDSDWYGVTNTNILLSRDYPEGSSNTGIHYSKRIGVTSPRANSLHYTVTQGDINSLGGPGDGFRIQAASSESYGIQGSSEEIFSIVN